MFVALLGIIDTPVGRKKRLLIEKDDGFFASFMARKEGAPGLWNTILVPEKDVTAAEATALMMSGKLKRYPDTDHKGEMVFHDAARATYLPSRMWSDYKAAFDSYYVTVFDDSTEERGMKYTFQDRRGDIVLVAKEELSCS